jgi:DNA-directed RNA polymerase specialized sigma24 family protein
MAVETRPTRNTDVPPTVHRETRMARFIRWADDYTLWAFNPPAALIAGASPTRRAGAQAPASAPVDDPVATLRDLERLRCTVDKRLEDLHEESAQVVRLLRRRGWSFGRIAAETGISNVRVAQLARASLGRGW